MNENNKWNNNDRRYQRIKRKNNHKKEWKMIKRFLKRMKANKNNWKWEKKKKNEEMNN